MGDRNLKLTRNQKNGPSYHDYLSHATFSSHALPNCRYSMKKENSCNTSSIYTYLPINLSLLEWKSVVYYKSNNNNIKGHQEKGRKLCKQKEKRKANKNHHAITFAVPSLSPWRQTQFHPVNLFGSNAMHSLGKGKGNPAKLKSESFPTWSVAPNPMFQLWTLFPFVCSYYTLVHVEALVFGLVWLGGWRNNMRIMFILTL